MRLSSEDSLAAVIVAELVRDGLDSLSEAGVSAMRQRRAARLLMPALAAPTAAQRAQVMTRLEAGPRVFLCHMNGLGALPGAIGEGVLYPGAETGAAALGALFAPDRLRLVVGMPQLTRFFTTAAGPFARSLRRARWEQLYELSWADRIEMIRAILPEAEILVLTDQGAARRSADVAPTLFGVPIGSEDAFLTAALTEPGRAALNAGMTAEEAVSLHGLGPDPEVLKARGIDESLTRLLDDRFVDDLERLYGMDGVQVI